MQAWRMSTIVDYRLSEFISVKSETGWCAGLNRPGSRVVVFLTTARMVDILLLRPTDVRASSRYCSWVAHSLFSIAHFLQEARLYTRSSIDR